MKSEILKNLIHRLVEIETDESPLISCFVNVENPRADYFTEIEAQANMVSRRLGGQRRHDFEDALGEVRDYLSRWLRPSTKSVAVYSRWGGRPTLLTAQFEVPMKSRFVVDELPHIYPLIELKDTYHRFVIVITTESQARVLETTIGAVTSEILAKRPELRQRVGREWTREHYRSHRREREQQFVREKVKVIDGLMRGGGHNHLVLAGSPKMVARLRAALPERLEKMLVSTVNANPRGGIDPIVLEAVQLFAAAENIESHDRVAQLEEAVLRGGLGVAGYPASREALEGGYAGALVIDQDLPDREVREELVRLAIRSGVPIETVKGSETLGRLAGVGCLLRYHPGTTSPTGLAA